MSYILDALNKAERERGIQPAPGFPKVPEAQRGKRTWRAVAVAAIVMGVGAILLFLLPLFWEAGPQEAAPASGNPGVERAAGSTSEPAGAYPPAGTPADPRSAQDLSAAASGSRPSAAATNPALRTSARTGQLPGTSAQTPAVNPQNAAGLPNLPAAEKERPAAVDAAVPPPVKETPPDPAAVQAAPLPLREAIAKMALNILLYHDDEAQRLAYINGKKYVKGDYVDGLYLIESIVSDGVWLRYGGQRLLLK